MKIFKFFPRPIYCRPHRNSMFLLGRTRWGFRFFGIQVHNFWIGFTFWSRFPGEDD